MPRVNRRNAKSRNRECREGMEGDARVRGDWGVGVLHRVQGTV